MPSSAVAIRFMGLVTAVSLRQPDAVFNGSMPALLLGRTVVGCGESQMLFYGRWADSFDDPQISRRIGRRARSAIFLARQPFIMMPLLFMRECDPMITSARPIMTSALNAQGLSGYRSYPQKYCRAILWKRTIPSMTGVTPLFCQTGKDRQRDDPKLSLFRREIDFIQRGRLVHGVDIPHV